MTSCYLSCYPPPPPTFILFPFLPVGSIADTAPRENLSGYLNMHMLLGAFQVVMAGLGIALLTHFDSTCQGALSDRAITILLIVVTTSQVRRHRSQAATDLQLLLYERVCILSSHYIILFLMIFIARRGGDILLSRFT